MSQIGKLFGHKADPRTHGVDQQWPIPDCYMGLELEYEGAQNKDVVQQKVKAKYIEFSEDTSLRGPNVELRGILPLSGADLTTALNELTMIVAEFKRINGVDLVLNKRTSLHAHMDVRNLDYEEFRRFKMLCIIFERPLIHYCAPDREYNNFCLPTYRAESQRGVYADLLSGERNLRDAIPEASKYMAINFLPLVEFGSVEFRSHQGSLDMNDVREWVCIIQCLKKAAVEMVFNTPTELLVHVSKLGAKELAKQVFGAWFDKVAYPELEVDVMDGARFVQDLLLYYDTHINSLTKPDLSSVEEAIQNSRSR
jgi:hypothetical protein